MDRTTQRVLSRMSFNKFCQTATKYVTIGQIKFYDGPDAGLSAGPRHRTSAPDLVPDQKILKY